MLDSYDPFHKKTSKHPAQMTSQILKTTSGKYMGNIIVSISQMERKEHLGTAHVSSALIKWGIEGAQEGGG